MPSTRLEVARVLACAATLATFLAPTTAHAQQRGYAVNRFEPSERGSEWFASESLDFRGNVRPAFGVVGDYSHQALAIYKPDGDLRSAVVDHNVLLHLGASVVLFERLRLAASLPLQVYTTGDTGTLHGITYAAPKNDQGIGDLRLSADFLILGDYEGPIRLAGGVSVWTPTGDRAQYMSDGAIRLAPHALVAGDIGMFSYSGKVGFNYHWRSETFAGSPIGSEVQLSAAAGLRFVDRKLLIGPEVFGTTYTEDPFKTRSTPLEIALGAHYTTSSGIRFGAGIGTGLTRGYGAPAVRALLNVEWAPPVENDRDHDGILDKDDACPDVAGVHTDDPKTNGCPPPPPPPDRDHDGVLDQDDACVDVPGVKTGDPKTNGCPPDRDQDGIIDSQDACPDDKGVQNADPMLNGCPDTDGDGVFDPDDVCPKEPGLKTTDPKTNGCPDPDRDKDGIVNEQDACPDEPGKADPDPKRNGCPKAFVQAGQIKILDQVKFKTNSADILPGKDSEEVLQAVLKVLNEHSEIKKVRIEGHTDSTGSAALNRTLSANRAKSVMKWLTGHGIAADRLTSAGFGPDKPIDDNATPAGRQNNRRVEFHIEQ
jgi:outer membrane protein OmpA-like peptidoglycan-associated protein